MKAWDIYSYQLAHWPEPHPAVIVSHPARVSHKPEVSILLCSTKANRAAEPHEVVLDQSDVLDWPTLCRCDLLYTVPKSQLTNLRGRVTPERRRKIITTINQANDWV